MHNARPTLLTPQCLGRPVIADREAESRNEVGESGSRACRCVGRQYFVSRHCENVSQYAREVPPSGNESTAD